MIRSGRADVMIAGGADAPIVPGVVRAWEAMRVLAPPAKDPARTCRPFSKDRLGITLGEGAGIVVLESWERATARGATIVAEVAGYGATADAAHVTQPGTPRRVRGEKALVQAGLAPSDITTRERARHRDAAERCHGDRRAEARFGSRAAAGGPARPRRCRPCDGRIGGAGVHRDGLAMRAASCRRRRTTRTTPGL
jgi:hypothetical protein